MGFVANFLRFPGGQNRLRFDKVTDSLNVGTFSDTVYWEYTSKDCLHLLPVHTTTVLSNAAG